MEELNIRELQAALQSAEARAREAEAFIRRVASTTIPECAAYDADAALTAIIYDARQALGASHG